MSQSDAVCREMDRLRGRMLQTIESLALPQDRERAVKGVLKGVTYDAQERLQRLVEDDALAHALSDAQAALTELQKSRRMLAERKKLGQREMDAASFLDARIEGVKAQIEDLVRLADIKARYGA